ncbi:protein SINE1 [Sesamum alatum]|uniref:Protein SINE1 n=1 Tax=Sesamum alatum TaxID=300844 RepID=A0AAE1XJL1_9LAMI|nr:protein SINE1 [Sesamum alatum]
MGRSLSPILRRELENLDKDADSRKSAMKALKSYVKDLDSKAIPIFLAQVSETRQTGISSGEHTISLYEVLARVHGPKIVPQIDNIMNTIIKTLSSSVGAFALHQACAKVVPAIARYAIDPTTAEDRKRYVIHSLCKPLSDCLLGSQENLSSGAALCLQALVESDNWRFASNEMINEVCQRVAGALGEHSQTNSHMALVTALAKHNSLIVEAYARLLIQSGLQILDAGFAEANSQKQLSSIHMLSSLMRCLDPKSILSELELVIKEMEKCQSDRMPFVTGAAFEALQIAKRICADKGSKLERGIGSASGSNFDRMDHTMRKNICSSGESPYTLSPESQTVDSFVGYDYFIESPNSMNQGQQGAVYDRRSVNRKLWRRCENDVLDVSLKDGLFSDITRGSDIISSEHEDFSHNNGDYLENFAGFVQGSAENGVLSSNTLSPQRSNSHINVDDVKIFTTPRKLIRSLQDLDDSGSGFSMKHARRFRSPKMSAFAWTPTSMREQNGLSQDMDHESKRDKKSSSGGDLFHGSSESVSSTEDVFTNKNVQLSPEVVQCIKPSQLQRVDVRKNHSNSSRAIVSGLFVVLVAVFLCLLALGGQDDYDILVPT